MSTSSADLGFPSLLNRMKLLGPDGRFQTAVVEQLSKFNPLLQDSYWKEANGVTGETVSSRVGLPSISARRFNAGVSPSRSTYNQWVEACSMTDGWSVVDAALARLNGDEAAYRAAEDQGFILQFNNTMESNFFNASAASTPELFNGLTPRFASSTATGSGKQVVKVDGSASGSNQNSIWLVGWGDRTVYGIYPKGSMGGIRAEAFPLLPVSPSNNGALMPAYQTHFEWHAGLVVKDYRYVARCCNFDTNNASGTADLIIPAMIIAYHKIYNINGARFAWYCNRFTGQYLHLQARNKTQYQLQVSEPGGANILSMLGIPIRISDALTSTEAIVS